MSSRGYSITEPHPSVPQTHYAHVGRGGAGNWAHVDPKRTTNGADAKGPASRSKLQPPPSDGYFLSGRGGAGNVHQQRERAIFSFDEELERQRKMMEHQAPIYHVGRGGAGNFSSEYSSQRRHGSGSSLTSNESGLSRLGATLDKLRKH